MGDNLFKMRVALFSDTFYETNGVSNTYKKFFEWAKLNGKPVDFYLYDDSISSPFEIENHGTVNIFKFLPHRYIKYYENLKFELFSNPFIKNQFAKYNYSVAHIATPGSLGIIGRKLSQLKKIKMVGVYHTKFEEYISLKFPIMFRSLIKDFIIYLTKIFYKNFSIVLAPTENLAKWIERNNICKSGVFSRGVDCNLFKPILKKFKKNFIYVGRISEEKNLDLIKKAYYSSDKSMSLVFTGDGPYREVFEKNFPHAKFNGYKFGSELISEYQKGDLFIFPSLTDTFGNVVQEAMSCGVPCLVLDKNGPGEIISHGEDGWIAKNEFDFIRLFNNLTKSEEIIRKAGILAREKMKKRSWDKIFNDLWCLYEDQIL